MYINPLVAPVLRVLAFLPLLLSVLSCGIPVNNQLASGSMSEEIAQLRAAVARDRASYFDVSPAQNTDALAENNSEKNLKLERHIGDQLIYPGERTVEEHSRWPLAHQSHPVVGKSASKVDRAISLNVVNLPLNVLLYSLAEEAKLQLLLEGKHDHPVTLRVIERPLSDILASVAQQAPFRWQLNGQELRISPDLPYMQTYPVNYLNLTRHMQGSVGLATQVGSINLSQDSGGGSGFSNSSQSLIGNESHHAFWESLIDGMNHLFDASGDSPAVISVNRDASLVTVRAKYKQHADIKKYLHEIEKSTQRQVLIEATVVEINLSDKFSAGIDWRMLGEGKSAISAAQIFHGKPEVQPSTVESLPAPSALLSAIHQSNTLGKITATLNLLSQFGDVKILSRPQIIAINNQSAVLKVVDNRVYFTMKVERHSSDGEDELTTETEIHTVPVGLVMSVTPFVAADNTVVLNVRPTISRILGFVNDPNPELAIARVQNGVPEIQVREMESVLKVGSGQIAMIGGLMQEQQVSEHAGVAWLDRLPLVGSLFSHEGRRTGTTELLVFLQPTVLQGGDLRRP